MRYGKRWRLAMGFIIFDLKQFIKLTNVQKRLPNTNQIIEFLIRNFLLNGVEIVTNKRRTSMLRCFASIVRMRRSLSSPHQSHHHRTPLTCSVHFCSHKTIIVMYIAYFWYLCKSRPHSESKSSGKLT